VFKYRGGHLVRITPEGEITLDTHGYHNASYIIIISSASCIAALFLKFYCLPNE
jgi:hypothetical protein